MLLPMTAEDVVVGIFQHIKNKYSTAKLTADREKLHRAFYQVKTNFPDVMSVFMFRQREQFPESPQLDQALSNLDATGLITRQNLTPRYYYFAETLGSSYDKFSKNILANNGIKESELEKIASEIEEIVEHS